MKSVIIFIINLVLLVSFETVHCQSTDIINDGKKATQPKTFYIFVLALSKISILLHFSNIYRFRNRNTNKK